MIKMKALKEIGSWVSTFGIAVVLSLIIGVFVIQPYKVDGHSMDPTLQDKERIYVSKISHTLSKLPEYGDVVVIDSRVSRERHLTDDLMEHPLLQLFMKNKTNDNAVFYVKRVLGKPGDVLEFKEHKTYRNGVALDEPYLNETMNFVSDKQWTVPEGHIFVMGDNRNHSSDSREIGYIPLNHVMGVKKFP